MSKILIFSNNWSKLNSEFFTTIRRRKKILPGETIKVMVKTTNTEFSVKCLLVDKVLLKDIPTVFLCYDTDTTTREEAIGVINSFYRNPILPDDFVYCFLLKKERNK